MKFSRYAAALLILKVKQAGGKFAKIVVGVGQFGSALLYFLLQFALGLVQRSAIAAHKFAKGDDGGGSASEGREANGLRHVRHTYRKLRGNKQVAHCNHADNG